MTLWIGNGAILKKFSQWQLKEFLKKIIHGRKYLFFKILLTQRHLLMPLGNKPFEHTVGKFLPLPQCFLLVWITFCHFRQI